MRVRRAIALKNFRDAEFERLAKWQAEHNNAKEKTGNHLNSGAWAHQLQIKPTQPEQRVKETRGSEKLTIEWNTCV